jgi:hypothetical protein
MLTGSDSNGNHQAEPFAAISRSWGKQIAYAQAIRRLCSRFPSPSRVPSFQLNPFKINSL